MNAKRKNRRARERFSLSHRSFAEVVAALVRDDAYIAVAFRGNRSGRRPGAG